MDIPCKNCLVFPMCKQGAEKFNGGPFKYIELLAQKCDSLNEYIEPSYIPQTPYNSKSIVILNKRYRVYKFFNFNEGSD
jgi:hypothetical protein